MTSSDARQRKNGKLSQRAEKVVSLPPEEYLKAPAAEVQGLVRDLVCEIQELQTKVEQLDRDQSELSKSRQEAVELLEFAPAGYLKLDSRGVVSNVNITVCDMLGISKSAMIGAPFANQVEPRYWDDLRSYLKDIADTGQRLSAEFEMRRNDGTTFFARLQTVPLYEKSEITYRLWVTDITERKRTETALRESEKKYRDLAELLPEIVFETDVHGKLTYANARAMALLGLTAEEMTEGFSVFEFIIPEQRTIAGERFKQVLEGKEVGHNEYILCARSGATFPAIVHSARIEVEGTVRGVRGIATDVTERKKVEEALRESENLFRTTLDSMLEGCIIVDFNWRYLYANDAAARLTGIPKEERVGKTVMEVIPGIEKQEVWAHIKRCLEDRIADHYETEVALPDGRKTWFEQRAEPVPQGMLLLYTDISEHKVAERRLKDGVERMQRIYGSARIAIVKPVGLLMIEHRLIERVVALLVREKIRTEQTNKLDREFIEYVADFFRTYADKTHHGKEENVLFKALAAKPLTPEHKKMMDELVQEHIQGRQLVTDLVAAKERWVAGDSDARNKLLAAIDGLVELYPRHIEKEDKLFFLPAAEYLSPPEMNDMLLEFWEYDRQMVHRRYTEGLETLTRMQAERYASRVLGV